MTKKDYIVIARLIQAGITRHGDYVEARRALSELTVSCAKEFESTNARFDKIRFFIACGLPELTSQNIYE